jgi:hypothetical protein
MHCTPCSQRLVMPPQCGHCVIRLTTAPASLPPFDLQEHGGDASAGYAEMGSKGGSEGGSKGGQARKEQLAEVSNLHTDVPGFWQHCTTCDDGFILSLGMLSISFHCYHSMMLIHPTCSHKLCEHAVWKYVCWSDLVSACQAVQIDSNDCVPFGSGITSCTVTFTLLGCKHPRIHSYQLHCMHVYACVYAARAGAWR